MLRRLKLSISFVKQNRLKLLNSAEAVQVAWLMPCLAVGATAAEFDWFDSLCGFCLLRLLCMHPPVRTRVMFGRIHHHYRRPLSEVKRDFIEMNDNGVLYCKRFLKLSIDLLRHKCKLDCPSGTHISVTTTNVILDTTASWIKHSSIMYVLGTKSIRTKLQPRFKQGSAGINSST